MCRVSNWPIWNHLVLNWFAHAGAALFVVVAVVGALLQSAVHIIPWWIIRLASGAIVLPLLVALFACATHDSLNCPRCVGSSSRGGVSLEARIAMWILHRGRLPTIAIVAASIWWAFAAGLTPGSLAVIAVPAVWLLVSAVWLRSALVHCAFIAACRRCRHQDDLGAESETMSQPRTSR